MQFESGHMQFKVEGEDNTSEKQGIMGQVDSPSKLPYMHAHFNEPKVK